MKMKKSLIFAALSAVLFASFAYGEWQGEIIVSEASPHRLEMRLNGRLILDEIYGVENNFNTVNAVDFVVSGTNLLTIKIIETAIPEMIEEANGMTKRDGLFGVLKSEIKHDSNIKLRIGIDRSAVLHESDGKPGLYINETFHQYPVEYSFSITNAWPIKRHPWQVPAPAFTEADKTEIIAFLRGVARCYGNLKSDAVKETLWNMRRFEFLQQALFEGMSPEDKKKQIFAAWDRMAPFIIPHPGPDYSYFEIIPHSGINLVSAQFPRGYPYENLIRDGVVYHTGAAHILAKKKPEAANNIYSKGLPLPSRFSKINGKWQSLYDSSVKCGETVFLEAEERNGGPLEVMPPTPEPHNSNPPLPDPVPEEKQWKITEPPDTHPGAPGYGAPGKILPFKVGAELAPHLKKYNLTAHWFVRDPLPKDTQGGFFTRDGRVTNSIPFLLFTPKTIGSQKVPIVWFIPGNGELGPDLTKQFHQKTIFEVVTSDEFQRKHPCYLFVVVPPEKQSMLRGTNSMRLHLMGDLMNDALFNVIAASKAPVIDKERIYLTGLSFGATAVYDFAQKIPDRFAAVMPVASYGGERNFHPERAADYWHFYNEKNSQLSPRHDDLMAFLQHHVETRGGEFKISTFPDEGHNAWDKAWREEAVWDWMFSKRAKNWNGQWTMSRYDLTPPGPIVEGFAASHGAFRKTNTPKSNPPKITAPAAASEEDNGVDRMLDELSSTYYLTTNAITSSDWVTLEYKEPVSGNFTITSGKPDGSARISPGAVEVSPDGIRWTQAAIFNNDGISRFKQEKQIGFLRIRHTASQPRQIAIRQVMRK